MCIDVEFVKGLLKHMIDKLDDAKLTVAEGESLMIIEQQLGEAVKTYELLREHMKGAYTSEGEVDWDALVHSLL